MMMSSTGLAALFLALALDANPSLAQNASQQVAQAPQPPARSAPSQPPKQPAQPTAGALALDKFMKTSNPVCLKEASTRCVDLGWAAADSDKNGTLSLAEVEQVRDDIAAWNAWKADSLTPRDRASLNMGLWAADRVGLPNLFASYDADGDGKLTKAELFADVKLDQRPIGQVMADEKAVDRKRFASRLGPLQTMAEVLMTPRPPGSPLPAPAAPSPKTQPLP
ncbi:MAG TPA: hypothetical protein VGO34_00675 [Alphaproteobacteria bacterium]|jgi:hypothetical protein